uniref:Uncharacterized protein n=1 Tax=Arundo donax TaxID=35708 RepID=A0A0A8YUL7_ARUDO
MVSCTQNQNSDAVCARVCISGYYVECVIKVIILSTSLCYLTRGANLSTGQN